MHLPLLCGQRKLRQKSSLKGHINIIEKFDTKSEYRVQILIVNHRITES